MYYTNEKAPTLAITYDATVSASTTVTFVSGATYIEVTAIAKGIFLAYNRTVSSSDFDEYIGVDSTKTYIIPSGATTANFIEQAATAALVCIQK